MKITYLFYSLKDLSDLSNGERFLEILLSNGLIIDKAGDHEPIRNDFIISNLPKAWKGLGIDGGCSSCYFLFKGKNEIKFSGMATWNINIHPNSKSFNGIHLWLNIPKNYSMNRLVQLGDDIFTWSEAVYGFITEEAKNNSNDMPGNIYNGISGLMWVNYFGSSFVKEPDFNIPNDHVAVGHGVRIALSENPFDEKLSDSNYVGSKKNMIGDEWFWKNAHTKVPLFDRSAITRR